MVHIGTGFSQSFVIDSPIKLIITAALVTPTKLKIGVTVGPFTD